VILATLRDLARALGCREDQAPDVVHSAASARATLSRRALLGASVAAAGAVATGSVSALVAGLDPLSVFGDGSDGDIVIGDGQVLLVNRPMSFRSVTLIGSGRISNPDPRTIHTFHCEILDLRSAS
jgi:hypothetical protein